MTDQVISTIIDRHLQYWIDMGGNMTPGEVEPEMGRPDEPRDKEGWQKWYPIASTVTDAEISDVEEQLNFQLPDSYKAFLKYRHFHELMISEATFRGHEIRKWKRNLPDMAFNGYPRQFLIDKGYIPFADWSDWGLLCFDTNQPKERNEYPVVLWDHERWDEFELYSDSFSSLILKLDSLSDSEES